MCSDARRVNVSKPREHRKQTAARPFAAFLQTNTWSEEMMESPPSSHTFTPSLPPDATKNTLNSPKVHSEFTFDKRQQAAASSWISRWHWMNVTQAATKSTKQQIYWSFYCFQAQRPERITKKQLVSEISRFVYTSGLCSGWFLCLLIKTSVHKCAEKRKRIGFRNWNDPHQAEILESNHF